LNTLTTLQVGAVAYILVSICFIYLLIDILIIFYSEKLIKYYYIEEKYPKLTKFINLRRKFNDYHTVSNCLIGICLLLYVLYINVNIIYHIFV